MMTTRTKERRRKRRKSLLNSPNSYRSHLLLTLFPFLLLFFDPFVPSLVSLLFVIYVSAVRGSGSEVDQSFRQQ